MAVPYIYIPVYMSLWIELDNWSLYLGWSTVPESQDHRFNYYTKDQKLHFPQLFLIRSSKMYNIYICT
jgi:hypothetical protein